MSASTVKFRDWVFEADAQYTRQVYSKIASGGADTCPCADCKNYSANRENIFPEEIITLFGQLGIDPRKEVEIWAIRKLESGLHEIAGWFHFKGKMISGKNCREPDKTGNGFAVDLTPITGHFEIGFTLGNDLAFFVNEKELVQVEFVAAIPWVIDPNLESD
jgi:hypothetical protein